MRLEELGGVLEGWQLLACTPPPNRRDMKLSSGLSVQVCFHGWEEAAVGGFWNKPARV